jgi:2-oxoglutarate ferredoxin oxidoreductase subunit gamma
MSIKRFLFAGFGGQGVLLMGQILSYGAMLSGKEVSFMPSYGPEMRGGTANCTVIISDEIIASPIASHVDVLVAMNGSSLQRFGELVKDNGVIFINSGMIQEYNPKAGIKVIPVDCKKLAAQVLHNEKVANVVMLGAVLRETGILETNQWKPALEAMFQEKRQGMIEINYQALKVYEDSLRETSGKI